MKKPIKKLIKKIYLGKAYCWRCKRKITKDEDLNNISTTKRGELIVHWNCPDIEHLPPQLNKIRWENDKPIKAIYRSHETDDAYKKYD